MIKTPRIINVGRSRLVYEGEEYVLTQGVRVKKHTINKSLPARQTKDFSQLIAVYSEILHNDMSVSHLEEMMDRAEIEVMLAKAKTKKKQLTEKDFRMAAKGEAILKTEFHALESGAAPANPLFKERPLGVYKLFAWLSPLALYGYIYAYFNFAGYATEGWFISSENLTPVLYTSVALTVVTLVLAVHWLIVVTEEINESRDIKLNIPASFGYVIVLVPWFGLVAWILFAGRFTRNVNRLIGRTPAGVYLGWLIMLIPVFTPLLIVYFQRRLNILDKNKMSFIVD